MLWWFFGRSRVSTFGMSRLRCRLRLRVETKRRNGTEHRRNEIIRPPLPSPKDMPPGSVRFVSPLDPSTWCLDGRLERWQRRIYMIFVLMRSDESEDYKKISNHILGKRVDVFSNWKVCELRSTCYLKSENAVFFLIWRDVLMFDIHGNSEGQRRCVAYRVKSVIGWEPSWILRGSYSWWLGSYNSPIHRIFPLRLG